VPNDDQEIASLIKQIPAGPDKPAAGDELSAREELSLKPAQHVKKLQRDCIKDLQRRIDAKYHVADRFSTLVFCVCSPVVLVGSLMIGNEQMEEWAHTGWGLVVVATGIQFLIGLFNPRI
jgi:hypothetical protein